MHDTLVPGVKAYIDSVTTYNNVFVTGWCFHTERGVLPLQIRTKSKTLNVHSQSRPDVSAFFHRNDIDSCGWSTEVSAADFGDAVLQIKVGNEFEDALYLNGREITPSTFLISRSVPSYLVVDNFYVEPDKVRDFALKQEFQYHPDYHKGKRTNTVFRFPGLKERFEQLLNRGVRNWEHYGVNGVFQYCESGDEIVWHTDAQQYAGVLFLTPDAPPDTGTTIYRSKTTKATKVLPGRYHDTFPRGHLCGDDFDVVDVVGNVYNRLVLFDGHLIHAASKYFGTNKENGRLFQLFFFDLD